MPGGVEDRELINKTIKHKQITTSECDWDSEWNDEMPGGVEEWYNEELSPVVLGLKIRINTNK
jgi:hypothetical protein